MQLAVGTNLESLKKSIFSANQIPDEFIDHFHVRRTSVLEKFIPSLINSIIAFGLATPVLMLYGPTLIWRWAVVLAFAFYEFFMVYFLKDRCLGMRIMDTYWENEYSLWQHFRYNIFYTLSFATFLIYVWVPFDLLLMNLIFIQLPFVLFIGTTLHGYLSRMESVRIIKK